MDAINDFLGRLNEFMNKETSTLMNGLLSEMNIKMPTGGGQMFDPYPVLGLDKTCTDAELKAGYRDLMKTLHPDVSGSKTTFLASMVNASYALICQQRGISK